jgi:CRISPR-associated protein Cas2
MHPSDSAPDLPPALPEPETALPRELATFPTPVRMTHDERHKYLVAYDVRDPGRLARLHRRLKDFGRPVQFSVFEALLNGTETEKMWSMVTITIDVTRDWVALYRLSRPFDEAVRHIGAYDPDLPANDLIIFI